MFDLSAFKKPTCEQAIALAGVFQACHLVEQLARNGRATSDEFATCVHAIFEQNPESTEAVYGGARNLKLGVDTLHEQLTLQRNGQASDALRYAVGVTHLQGRLLRDKNMLVRLSNGIDRARSQAEHFSQTHENIIANLADLYQNTISTFRYRIQVNGFADYLRQEDIASRIRTLLLSGVRSAVLWKQLGGSRWHLILYRKDLVKLINKLQSKI
ncbi:high frequency lysogenization protein HflD [bacterium SCSIO 12696]|nr:high frequency lysogenization protein HflD [bacterium SCSIO 12696]